VKAVENHDNKLSEQYLESLKHRKVQAALVKEQLALTLLSK
jgi:hypothetical protein